MKLSNRQAKTAGRFIGAQLMIPWPAALPDPARGPTRDTTAGERQIIVRLIGEECARHDLVVHDTTVMWPDAERAKGRPFFVAFVVHKRWPQEQLKIDPTFPWIWLDREAP